MTNTSATGGYLQPSTTAPTHGLALDEQLQGVIAGVTGITGSLVRPRWQPRPPQQPARDQTWAAVGIMSVEAEGFAHVRHDGAGDGSDIATQFEVLDLLVTFYGPDAAAMAARLRDGLAIAQNREAARANGLAYVGAGRVTLLGELVNQEIIRRADVTLTFRRAVSRTYPVLNLLSAQIAIETEEFGTTFTVEN